MGFSEVFVQVHYCSDVIGGLISGIICAGRSMLIVKFLYPYADKGLTRLSERIKEKRAVKAE